ncbi:unnamed protein product [Owenia fusiformis]|uniref:SGNH hydrolase-type esterase domain-containing protein n=1 Tax=Owenia fusiformis TaxID=6347 RepID=A0A8S4P5G3_OWEFU|nr:unnamed protein product [Owenia fusiformis]
MTTGTIVIQGKSAKTLFVESFPNLKELRDFIARQDESFDISSVHQNSLLDSTLETHASSTTLLKVITPLPLQSIEVKSHCENNNQTSIEEQSNCEEDSLADVLLLLNQIDERNQKRCDQLESLIRDQEVRFMRSLKTEARSLLDEIKHSSDLTKSFNSDTTKEIREVKGAIQRMQNAPTKPKEPKAPTAASKPHEPCEDMPLAHLQSEIIKDNVQTQAPTISSQRQEPHQDLPRTSPHSARGRTTNAPKDQTQKPIRTLYLNRSTTSLIIGDSRLRKVKPQNLGAPVAVRTYGGATLSNIKDSIDSSKDSPNLRNITLQAGIIDIKNGSSMLDIKADTMLLIETAKSKFPNAKFLISSIIPMLSHKLNESVREANTMLESLAKSTPNVSYHSCYEQFGRFNTVDRNLFYDQSHLNDAGVAKLETFLKSLPGNCESPTESIPQVSDATQTAVSDSTASIQPVHPSNTPIPQSNNPRYAPVQPYVHDIHSGFNSYNPTAVHPAHVLPQGHQRWAQYAPPPYGWQWNQHQPQASQVNSGLHNMPIMAY